jgi:diguanylate cyclase (GGDEF)-like protein/PAS domain S-box-containing protein
MKDGRIFDRYTAPMTLPDGRYVGRVWFFCDITERKRTEEQLREKEEKYRAIFSAESDGILVVDQETGVIIDCNNAITALYGYQKAELIGQSNLIISAEPEATRAATITSPPRIPLRYHRKKDGTVFPVEIATVLLSLHGHQIGLATIRDITQCKAMEDKLRSAALTDRLTGLPNRTLLVDRLQMAIERHKRTPELMYGVLFLDLDRFKTINDSLGHKTGDQLLSAVAKRLAVELRSEDTISRRDHDDTAARLGGDEFVILLENLHSEVEAVHVAQRLLKVLSEPYFLGEHEIVSTASIGIVTSGGGHDRAEDVLRDADTAMYEAKSHGSDQALVFDTAMRARVSRKMELENGIRKALEMRQFVLHYQPIVSLETGRLESLEVLLRWEHQQHGTISPVEFIPVAEETGLIIPLGEWTFRAACEQLAQWWAKDGRNSVPSISVNLSRRQLSLPGLPERFHEIARAAGVAPEAIHLEVTESTFMDDAIHGAAALKRMRTLGFKIDMDDFGTGYSSLSCLLEFPVDVIKIDRSFVMNMTRGKDFATLVGAIAMVAWNLGIHVIAEGVETADQVSMLQSLGCHFAQGYYFARPMPADNVMPYLANLQRVGAAASAGKF